MLRYITYLCLFLLILSPLLEARNKKSPTPTPKPKSPSSPPSSGGGSVRRSTATDFDGSSGAFAFCQSNVSPSAAAKKGEYMVAVHSKDKAAFEGHMLAVSLTSGMSNPLHVYVVDYCADSDCGGCCTQNADYNGNDFLLDFEENTAKVFFPNYSPDTIFQTIYFQDLGFAGTSSSYPCKYSADAMGSDPNTFADGSSPSLTIGAIIGISVGAVALIVIVVLVVLLITQKKNSQERV